MGERTLDDLPADVREGLLSKRTTLKEDWHRNDDSRIMLVNEKGTRYFYARKCVTENRGRTKTEWSVMYGAVQFMHKLNATMTAFEYYWTRGRLFKNSRNGTEIPKSVKSKRKAIELALQIGIFDVK